MFDNLIAGFAFIMNWGSIAAALCGIICGIIVGALPGLSATMAVAVLAPFTFFMAPQIGIPFLLGVFKAAIWGGSISAVTINTPGTAAAAAMVLDGHALARKGQARRALEVSLYSSVAGDMFSTILLIFAATSLATVAVNFGPPEFVMLYLLALVTIASVSGRHAPKAVFSTGLGFLIACIGLDPMSGAQRFTFGSSDLIGGIGLIPLLIGLFALSEVLIEVEKMLPRLEFMSVGCDEPRATLKDMRSVAPTILRSSCIGFFIGLLPGIGAEIACWLSYGFAKRQSKNPEEYGKGSIEGVAAAESGANSACPGDLIPMMVFGIPGDTVTAVLLGAFMAQGLTPGPQLFEKHATLVYGFFAVLIISNLMMLGLGYLFIRYLRRITMIPPGLLYPAVVALCFAGSFAVNSSYFDLGITVIGGVAGFIMRKLSVPIAPLVIAMLVAPGLENALRQSLQLSDGSLAIFLTRPVSAGLFAVIALGLSLVIWKSLRSNPLQKETPA